MYWIVDKKWFWRKGELSCDFCKFYFPKEPIWQEPYQIIVAQLTRIPIKAYQLCSIWNNRQDTDKKDVYMLTSRYKVFYTLNCIFKIWALLTLSIKIWLFMKKLYLVYKNGILVDIICRNAKASVVFIGDINWISI